MQDHARAHNRAPRLRPRPSPMSPGLGSVRERCLSWAGAKSFAKSFPQSLWERQESERREGGFPHSGALSCVFGSFPVKLCPESCQPPHTHTLPAQTAPSRHMMLVGETVFAKRRLPPAYRLLMSGNAFCCTALSLARPAHDQNGLSGTPHELGWGKDRKGVDGGRVAHGGTRRKDTPARSRPPSPSQLSSPSAPRSVNTHAETGTFFCCPQTNSSPSPCRPHGPSSCVC